jgi:hypothetical protein
MAAIEAIRDTANSVFESLRKADSTYRDSVNKRQTEFTMINNATSVLKRAHRERDHVTYNKDTGTVHVALKIKDYIASVFGVKSQEYKSVSKLQFKIQQQM